MVEFLVRASNDPVNPNFLADPKLEQCAPEVSLET